MFSFFNLLAISYPQMFLLAKWLLINIGYKRFMVWCCAGLQGDFLSVYTDLFYEP